MTFKELPIGSKFKLPVGWGEITYKKTSDDKPNAEIVTSDPTYKGGKNIYFPPEFDITKLVD